MGKRKPIKMSKCVAGGRHYFSLRDGYCTRCGITQSMAIAMVDKKKLKGLT